VTQKFIDALPLYRLEKILTRHGVRIPRATLCNWVIMASERCSILTKLLRSDVPVYLFHYDPTRSSQVVRDYLGDYHGYAQTDGYPGYDFLDTFKNIHHVGCLAHARRMFVDAAKIVPKK
jgi:transposase